jgi:hypothetical protein
MAAADFIRAADQVLDQDPMWLLILPRLVGVIDAGNTASNSAVVMLEAGIHQFAIA